MIDEPLRSLPWGLALVFAGGCSPPATRHDPQATLAAPVHSEPLEIALWPGVAPHAEATHSPENATSVVRDTLVAGKPWTWVTNVSRPTLTVYPAHEPSRDAAVLVFPGGGYHGLAVDLEGTEACDWLTSRGITCVLLKYRVPGELGPGEHGVVAWGEYQESPMALDDAQRALGVVRFHAREWKIDPKKLGVLGFSAGGHLVAATSTRFDHRDYAPVDAADAESCRPDFGIALYPGHLAHDATPEILNPAIRVTPQTPPTMLVQAEDDPVDPVANARTYYAALKKAGVPAELHVFPRGGHAFGLRLQPDLPITRWPALAETWLRSLGI